MLRQRATSCPSRSFTVSLASALVMVFGLGACTDADVEPAETEESEFVTSCLDAIPEATGEMCTCAETSACEHMSEDGYAMFLISFLPDRDERADAIMQREGFHVDVERFSLAMFEVIEAYGFGDLPGN